MVVVYRTLGWLLLAMAVAAMVHDGLAWWAERSFHLMGLGDLWSQLDIGSLGKTQAAVQRHLSVPLWTWIVRPLLLLPALPTFLVLSFFFFWLGSRASGRPEPGMLTGSRPPRRRRSRGLS